MKILVTGAAGFIGSCFVRKALNQGMFVVILDKLTYAGNLSNISDLIQPNICEFIKGDIADRNLVSSLYKRFEFDAVVNLAAESHVDNSIHSPKSFIDTNIIGTFNLLECSREYWNSLSEDKKKSYRYIQVSTDEVYGSLSDNNRFNESYPYKPNSPYSASKASADHLVRAWFHTYKLPTITTNCSNNYGPRQNSEKLIPLIIKNAIDGKSLPIYGTGNNIRDWIHVEDHCNGIYLALINGTPGETYCFGGDSERKNLDVVNLICTTLDKLKPKSDGSSYHSQICFITDRAGHDWRYAIDDSKAQHDLSFKRKYTNFEIGLEETINWYLNNSL